jgi:predicted PurR-regulated permease PerM
MHSQQPQQINQQAQAIAIAKTEEGRVARFWFLTLALFFAGVFYFYGYWYPLLWARAD